MPLVTVDEVEQWLGIDLTGDTRSVDLLDRFIASASTKVETWCRRSFEFGSVTAEPHLLDASGAAYLNRVPVLSISLVNMRMSDDTLQAIPPAQYDVNAQSGLVRITSIAQNGGTCTPTGTIEVTYTGGEFVVPEQVKEATIHVVSMLWYAKGRDAAMSQQSAGNFTKTLGVDPISGLPVSAETLLLDYRRVLGALV